MTFIINRIKIRLKNIQNESLTVMVIPHSGNRGLSFHINYLHFCYFIFLLLVFIFLTIYSLKISDLIEEKQSLLRKTSSIDSSLITKFTEKYKKIGALIFNMGKAGESIYSLSGQLDKRTNYNLKAIFGERSNYWIWDFFNNKKVTLSELKYNLAGTIKIIESLRKFFSNFSHFDPDKITLFPINNGYLVRGYDLSIPHIGLDIGAPWNTSVMAAASGRVIRASWYGNYGWTVEIRHRNSKKTLYAHNSRLIVKAGDWVVKGSIIAFVGSTGRSSGNHLHFEVRNNGKAENPLPYVKFFIRPERVNPNIWAKLSVTSK